MQNVTIRLPVRLLAELERDADQQGVSRSEYIRDTLATRHEHERTQREYDRLRAEYEAEIADLEQDLEVCRNQNKVLTDAYQLNAETTELVKRRKDRADASLVERARWWVFGRDK